MALFKRIYEEKLLFTKRNEHKYKPIIELKNSNDSFIITYLDNNVKKKLQLNVESIGDYRFIKKTKNLFHNKFKTLSPQDVVNEMTTGDAGIGGTATDQFSGDFYAPDDARNLFNNDPKFPIIRRPKINDQLTKNSSSKKKKSKKKKTSNKRGKK